MINKEKSTVMFSPNTAAAKRVDYAGPEGTDLETNSRVEGKNVVKSKEGGDD